MPEDHTFIEQITKQIKSQSTNFDPGDEISPTVILWPDENREWEPMLPLLRKHLPILTWGPYDKLERSGPAVWIRCMVSRVLPEKFSPNTILLVYLPGISQEMLIDCENRPQEIGLLAELIYSGVCWTGADGICWSVFQFFQDEAEGLGVQMRDDDFTRKAMLRALPVLSDMKISQLKAEEPWKAKDFESLSDTDVKRLIELGESSNLEFKSTARWDIDQQKADALIEQVILKTVAGFLNSERGGTLLIGVEDNKNICGIELDYQTFKNTNNHNCDAYERWLVSLLLGVFGKEFATQIHPSFQTIDGKTVCKLVIDPAPEPVFVSDKAKQDEIFYLRVGNATNPLGVKAAINFYKTRWASRN